MVVLYRSGKLEGSTASSPAPEIAVLFDTIAATLNLPRLRAQSVFFNTSLNDAMHWSGQRLYNGEDANIYRVRIASKKAYAYSIQTYNKFVTAYETYTNSLNSGNLTEAGNALDVMIHQVREYHATKLPLTSNKTPYVAERHEVLIHKETAQSITEWETVYEPELI